MVEDKYKSKIAKISIAIFDTAKYFEFIQGGSELQRSRNSKDKPQ